MKHTRLIARAAIATAVVLPLVACAQGRPAQESGNGTTEDGFPRTIQVPAGDGIESAELTLEQEPEAIAALGYETAEIAAEIGLADRLVLVPEAVLNPALGGHIEELSDGPETFPVEMELDAETVISHAPDLVIMSPRHGADTRIADVLEQAGIPTLMVPNGWSTPADLASNIELIGEATGAEQPASELATGISEGLVPRAAGDPAPRVLVLSNQAGRPFVTAGAAFPLELLDLAGADDVSDDLGLRATGPISAEQLVRAAPDGILLVDMNGSGTRLFDELLANPAVAQLPAVSKDRTLLIEGREVQALGLDGTIQGLQKLGDWVDGLPQS